MFAVAAAKADRLNVPVQAICILDDKDLHAYSQGSHLFVAHGQSVLRRYSVKTADAIHLIKYIQGVLYVGAGRALYSLSPLLEADGDGQEVALLHPDRILDVYLHDSTLYAVDGHARLQELTDKKSYKLASDQYVLYSACLGLHQGQLTVAFGTIFSGILLTRIDGHSLVLVKQLSGHCGSIFGIAMADTSIVSCSDDRTVQLVSQRGVLKCLGHAARVWKVLFIQGKYAVSVGEDSTCRIWSIDDGECVATFLHSAGKAGLISLAVSRQSIYAGGYDGCIVSWPLDHIGHVDEAVVLPSALRAKNFCLLNDAIIRVTEDGQVYRDDGLIYESPLLKSYTTVTGTNDNILVVGDLHGNLHVIDAFHKVFKASDEKIYAVYACDKYVLAQTVTTAVVIDLHGSLRIAKTLAETNVTSFFVNTRDDAKCFYVGTRHGFFKKLCFDSDQCQMLKVHEGHAITSIKTNDMHTLRLTDRSGCYSIVRTQPFEIILRERITKGWLEHSTHACATAKPEDVMFFGFIRKHFFAHSLNERSQTWRVWCAGQHRRWCFRWPTFAFLRDGLVYAANITKTSKPEVVLKHGAHHREIRDAVVLGDSARCSRVMTVGDDGNVCCILDDDGSKDGDNGGPLIVHATWHVSGIKSICAISEDVIVMGGSAEQLHAWRWDGAALRCRRTCPPASAVREARIMSVDALKSLPDDGLWMVAVGYTDSCIRTWSLNTAGNGPAWKLRQSFEAHAGHCVQHIRLIGEKLLLTAGTDGMLHLFDDDQLTASVSVHQSGINALDCLAAFESGDAHALMIATGGDDQSTALTLLCRQHHTFKLLANHVSHAAAITGIALLTGDADAFVIAAGLDRSIVVLSYCARRGSLQPVQRIRCDICDIGVLQVLGRQKDRTFDLPLRLFVGGVGYQFLTIDAIASSPFGGGGGLDNK